MNKGIKMNSISLKKVTLLVGTCALASYFVSAEDNVASLEVPAVEQVVTKPAATKVLSADKLVKVDKSIPTLLTQLDHDKNGSLNEAEVIASKDDQLVKHFKDIDKNADAEISEVELKSYLSALKMKN
jgi:phosphoribosylcarboxyaminoimidazole (NCAIR) mutase